MRFLTLFIFAIFSLNAAEKTPEQSLTALKEGNQRFLTNQSLHPNRNEESRKETSEKQEPIATILGCSDSRSSPEIIFDQGIGDLFVVRVAGNVVGPIELDSIEYSVIYLKSPLIVVLAHENCGAIKAVMDGTTKDIEAIARLIKPAVEQTRPDLESAAKTNAHNVAQQLRKSRVIAKLIKNGSLRVVSGYYNFHDGRVEILD